MIIKSIAGLTISLLLGASSAQGKVFSTLPQALAELFPNAKSQRETAVLKEEERAEIKAISGETFDRSLVFRYRLLDDAGELLATAYLDKHKVRSKPETVLVVVRPDGKLHRVKVLAFAEPLEYMPREAWYRQFDGKALSKSLRPRRDIDAVTGATLTVRATTACSRRVLAMHAVLSRREGGIGR
ncbi:MAG: FMN-binding protein [Planctomycetota bacterium]|jgi:hypothetical protein